MNDLSTWTANNTVNELLTKASTRKAKLITPSKHRKVKASVKPVEKARKPLTRAALKAVAKVAPVAPQPKPATEIKRKGRPCLFDLNKVITVLAVGNPRKAGGVGHAAFALYKAGMTVAQYLSKDGGEACHLRWDVKHGFISIA